MPIEIRPFGTTPGGTRIDQFTLRRGELSVRCINFGARFVGIDMPDRTGRCAPIVLGFDCLEPYLDDSSYFSPICGRYANWLAYGRFVLDGIEYRTPSHRLAAPRWTLRPRFRSGSASAS